MPPEPWRTGYSLSTQLQQLAVNPASQVNAIFGPWWDFPFLDEVRFAGSELGTALRHTDMNWFQDFRRPPVRITPVIPIWTLRIVSQSVRIGPDSWTLLVHQFAPRAPILLEVPIFNNAAAAIVIDIVPHLYRRHTAAPPEI